MSTFETTILIDAPIETVWAVLAEIGDIYRWNPGVVQSHTTSETGQGLGATRYCDLGGNNYLDEEVVVWQPGEKLTMRITGTNLPFETADIRFTLHPENNQTAVTVSPVYRLKYGFVGRFLDGVYVKGNYHKGMKSLLAGLKRYIEMEMVEVSIDGTPREQEQ